MNTADSAFRSALDGLELIDNPMQLRLRSRDYYWYSPILKRELDGKAADLIVVPRSIEQVVRTAAACARFSVPLVVRGGATGNYGQMVPLKGGVLLDMAELDRTLWIEGDRDLDLAAATAMSIPGHSRRLAVRRLERAVDR